MSHPHISIMMLTYNQEEYVSQAVESVLAQQTTHSYELVISDDASTDRTPYIVEEYADKHPDKIRFIRHKKNQGITVNAHGTMMTCKGDYIFILDGDDYYIDLQRLQKITDYLDAHPEIAILVTNCYKQVENAKERSPIYDDDRLKPPAIFDLDEYLDKNYKLAPPTIVYRTAFMPNTFPKWDVTYKWLDWLYIVLIGQHGKIAFIDECQSVYRIHSTSVTRKQIHPNQTITEYLTILKINKKIAGHVTDKYKKRFTHAQPTWYNQQLSYEYLKIGEYVQSIKHFLGGFAWNYGISGNLNHAKHYIKLLLYNTTPLTE